jgi:CubicO group peptidase (beta-lactamase class C family)
MYTYIKTLTKAIILSGALCLTLNIYASDLPKANPEDYGFSSKKLSELKPMLDPIVDEGKLPNYLVAIYTDGKLIYQSMKGMADEENNIPISHDTIFAQFSMTKPLVSAAILQLIEDGKIDIDDKLEDFYPAFSSMMVAPDGYFERTMVESARSITIKDLLTHTAGFTYGEQVVGIGDVAKIYDELNPSGQWGRSTQEAMDVLSEIPLVSQPGEEFNYSVSIDVLGAIIEKVSGKTLMEYLKSELLDPLEMNDSAFAFQGEKLQKVAQIYAAAPQRTVQVPGQTKTYVPMFGKNPNPYCRLEPNFYSGGGGICTSADDFARFLSMILNNGEFNGKRILSKESISLMTENLLPNNLGRNGLQNSFGDFAGNMYFGAGLGIVLKGDSEEKDYYWWAGAANTFFWADPDNNTVGIFLSQHFPVSFNLIDKLETHVEEAEI